MDGTVVDSTENDYNAWQKAFKEYGTTMPYDEFLSLLGAKGDEIVKKYLDISKEQTDEFLDNKEKYFFKFCDDKPLKFIDGVDVFLSKVKSKDISTALATGSGKEKLDFIFSKLDFKKYFDAVLSADDISYGKPNPEIFVKAAKKLNVQPNDALIFEDAARGVEAASNAGMLCTAITSTHSKSLLKNASYIIESYANFDWSII